MGLDEQVSLAAELGAATLEITVSDMEDRTLVVLAGELDAMTVPFLRERCAELLDGGLPGNDAVDVVLDIALLRFIDSTGLALFLRLHKKLDSMGHRLVIFSPTPMARRILQITGLMEFLRVLPAEPAAATRHRARRRGGPCSTG